MAEERIRCTECKVSFIVKEVWDSTLCGHVYQGVCPNGHPFGHHFPHKLQNVAEDQLQESLQKERDVQVALDNLDQAVRRMLIDYHNRIQK